MKKLTVRGWNTVSNLMFKNGNGFLPWEDEKKAKAQLVEWVKSGGDLLTIRNCGAATRREIEEWAGLPVTPLPAEIPRCKCCGQKLRVKTTK